MSASASPTQRGPQASPDSHSHSSVSFSDLSSTCSDSTSSGSSISFQLAPVSPSITSLTLTPFVSLSSAPRSTHDVEGSSTTLSTSIDDADGDVLNLLPAAILTSSPASSKGTCISLPLYPSIYILRRFVSLKTLHRPFTNLLALEGLRPVHPDPEPGSALVSDIPATDSTTMTAQSPVAFSLTAGDLIPQLARLNLGNGSFSSVGSDVDESLTSINLASSSSSPATAPIKSTPPEIEIHSPPSVHLGMVSPPCSPPRSARTPTVASKTSIVTSPIASRPGLLSSPQPTTPAPVHPALVPLPLSPPGLSLTGTTTPVPITRPGSTSTLNHRASPFVPPALSATGTPFGGLLPTNSSTGMGPALVTTPSPSEAGIEQIAYAEETLTSQPAAEGPRAASSLPSQDQPEEGEIQDSDQHSFKTPNVYINGLPAHYPEDQLFDLCAPFGPIRSVRSFTRHVGEKESGYGFVLFENVDSAEQCINALRKFRNLHPTFSKQIHKIPGTSYAQLAPSAGTGWNSTSAAAADEYGRISSGAGYPISESGSSSSFNGSAGVDDGFKSRMERLHDPTSTNLYIEGLPLSIDEPSLAALVSPHRIKSSRFFQTRLSNPPRIIAFVRLETRTGAEEVIERLHGRMVRGWNDPGSRISVRFADTSEQRELRRTERTTREGNSSPARITIAQAALLNLRGRDSLSNPNSPLVASMGLPQASSISSSLGGSSRGILPSSSSQSLSGTSYEYDYQSRPTIGLGHTGQLGHHRSHQDFASNAAHLPHLNDSGPHEFRSNDFVVHVGRQTHASNDRYPHPASSIGTSARDVQSTTMAALFDSMRAGGAPFHPSSASDDHQLNDRHIMQQHVPSPNLREMNVNVGHPNDAISLHGPAGVSAVHARGGYTATEEYILQAHQVALQQASSQQQRRRPNRLDLAQAQVHAQQAVREREGGDAADIGMGMRGFRTQASTIALNQTRQSQPPVPPYYRTQRATPSPMSSNALLPGASLQEIEARMGVNMSGYGRMRSGSTSQLSNFNGADSHANSFQPQISSRMHDTNNMNTNSYLVNSQHQSQNHVPCTLPSLASAQTNMNPNQQQFPSIPAPSSNYQPKLNHNQHIVSGTRHHPHSSISISSTTNKPNRRELTISSEIMRGNGLTQQRSTSKHRTSNSTSSMNENHTSINPNTKMHYHPNSNGGTNTYPYTQSDRDAGHAFFRPRNGNGPINSHVDTNCDNGFPSPDMYEYEMNAQSSPTLVSPALTYSSRGSASSSLSPTTPLMTSFAHAQGRMNSKGEYTHPHEGNEVIAEDH